MSYNRNNTYLENKNKIGLSDLNDRKSNYLHKKLRLNFSVNYFINTNKTQTLEFNKIFKEINTHRNQKRQKDKLLKEHESLLKAINIFNMDNKIEKEYLEYQMYINSKKNKKNCKYSLKIKNKKLEKIKKIRERLLRNASPDMIISYMMNKTNGDNNKKENDNNNDFLKENNIKILKVVQKYKNNNNAKTNNENNENVKMIDNKSSYKNKNNKNQLDRVKSAFSLRMSKKKNMLLESLSDISNNITPFSNNDEFYCLFNEGNKKLKNLRKYEKKMNSTKNVLLSFLSKSGQNKKYKKIDPKFDKTNYTNSKLYFSNSPVGEKLKSFYGKSSKIMRAILFHKKIIENSINQYEQNALPFQNTKLGHYQKKLLDLKKEL